MSVIPRMLITGAMAGVLVFSASQAMASAPGKPGSGKPVSASLGEGADNLPGPFTKRQKSLREDALTRVLDGNAKVKSRGGSKVVKLGKKKYAEVGRAKTDKIFTILAEFSDKRHPDYPDGSKPDDPNPPKVFDGPLHNKTEKPDRTKDNTTIWKEDFNREHFQKLYNDSTKDGESVKAYYERQSSGQYSTDTAVSDWVKLTYNEAYYGRRSGPPVWPADANPWEMVKDGVNAWYEQQKQAGQTDEQIKADLAKYDIWDRNDHDGDGDFNERDGYLDHFQIVHAGGGEEAQSGAQGSDAIWSHRWYAFGGDAGKTGPDYNKAGGTQVGQSGIWVGDYTTQPENGGVGIFAHEYAHDLGLPDEYDTTRKGYSPVGFWGLMDYGDYASRDRVNGRATMPTDMSAWDKLQLGWLDYATAKPGQSKSLKLSPASKQGAYDEALIAELPKKEEKLELGKPPEGRNAWWSNKRHGIESTLTRPVELPADGADGKVELTFKTWYETEKGYDLGFVEVNAGDGWKAVKGNITDAQLGEAIHGSSEGNWVDAKFDLSAYKGKKFDLRFHYKADDSLTFRGFMLDEFKLTAGGKTVFEDGAENGDGGWTAKEFEPSSGTGVAKYDNYYIAENRQWLNYDRGLKNSPAWIDRKNLPVTADYYAHHPGMLVSYWDTSQTNNNVTQHPGEGEILMIDASPKPVASPKADPITKWKYWTAREQIYDAAFGLRGVPEMKLRQGDDEGVAEGTFPAHKGVAKFDDTKQYWFAEQPHAGVKVRGAGVSIAVVKEETGKVLAIRLTARS